MNVDRHFPKRKNCGRKYPQQWIGALLTCMIVPVSTLAQTSKDPLTNDQVEQVRDTGDQPGQRVKLYMKFIDERTTEMHKITTNPRAQQPGVQLHNLLEEFTRLADELQDNLDTYSESHEDMRKTLRELVDHSGKWEAALHEPKPSLDYDFARKTSLDSAQSTNELAKKLLDTQEKYFATHKPPK